MAYCTHKPGKRYSTEQDEWEENYELFLKKGTWEYNFELEDTVAHYEQSFLSQMIFRHMLQLYNLNNYNVHRYYIYNENEVCLLFDVMNNPKNNHPLGRCGDRDENCESLMKTWHKNYHSIGNFTLTPRVTGLQFQHNKLGERWDLMLKYMKKHWICWENGNIIDFTFTEYMKYTCQQLYYQNIFAEFKKDKMESLADIKPGKWKEIVEGWNKKIDNNECGDIVNFCVSNIRETISDINFLIKARGCCILALLKFKSEN